MASMFDEISANKFKSYFLMLIFSLIIISLGYLFGAIYGNGSVPIIVSFMVIAFAISIIMSLIGFYAGDKAALSISGAKPVKKSEHPHYVNATEGLAIAAGIPVPKMYVINDKSINAFATGRDPEHASIAVTTGALEKLNRTELEGVIAHELSHVKNYDIRFMTIVVVLVGLIAILSDIFLRSMFFSGGGDGDRKGSHWVIVVLGIALAILAPIIAQLIKLAVSRKREYLADATGALISRHPQGLANALKKIKKESMPTASSTPGTEHMYFSHPLKKGFWNSMFSTHPPIDERIRRLEAM